MVNDANNRFYTLVPHDFGMKKPTVINTLDLVKMKTDMLNSLLDIEIAYNFIKNMDEQLNPFDQHYDDLKCEIQVIIINSACVQSDFIWSLFVELVKVVDKNSDEFKTILKYIQNTHGSTHNTFDLLIEDVFKVCREGEHDRYAKKYKNLHNKKLLWHGSRVTNYAGILSQGLRIAPPEAPSTGYMFGKGVYFADCVSKSANYCYTSNANPIGLLLLCEVALGDVYECTTAEYIEKLPRGKHSVKGIGRSQPNPKQSILSEDGVEIPLGTLASDSKQTSLLYNEYVGNLSNTIAQF
jgi:hypothetical protein